ncbi:MAG: TusE/DsrC/DsvC family sulfur relay protein [Elusimicrobia bacterium]|nr:TusE/DsrC/DsvC family sulfur relay protein [Elusimicrobiota bacterium]
MSMENQPAANFNEDGFLKEISAWNRGLAQQLAADNNIGPLTDDHWKVIEFIKDYYKTYQAGPAVIKISKATGLSLAKICDLFPCGVVKGGYRLAGLPRPPGCA